MYQELKKILEKQLAQIKNYQAADIIRLNNLFKRKYNPTLLNDSERLDLCEMFASNLSLLMQENMKLKKMSEIRGFSRPLTQINIPGVELT